LSGAPTGWTSFLITLYHPATEKTIRPRKRTRQNLPQHLCHKCNNLIYKKKNKPAKKAPKGNAKFSNNSRCSAPDFVDTGMVTGWGAG